MVVGAFQAEVLRHFYQANSVDDEDLGALEDEDGDFAAYLEDLDEVDDAQEFERDRLAFAEEEHEFVDIDLPYDPDKLVSHVVLLLKRLLRRSTFHQTLVMSRVGSRRCPCRRRSGPGRPRSRRGEMGTHGVRTITLEVAQAHRSQHADQLYRHVHAARAKEPCPWRRPGARRVVLLSLLSRRASVLPASRRAVPRARPRNRTPIAEQHPKSRPFVDAFQLQRVDATPRGVPVEVVLGFSKLRVEGVGVRHRLA